MEEVKKQKRYGTPGRRPSNDPAVYRLNLRMTAEENARFEQQFALSGLNEKTKFIKARLFGTPIKVIHIDKNTKDYYIGLMNFHAQFSAVGNNYNQTVRAIKANFGEKRGLAMLYRLEKTTADLLKLDPGHSCELLYRDTDGWGTTGIRFADGHYWELSVSRKSTPVVHIPRNKPLRRLTPIFT